MAPRFDPGRNVGKLSIRVVPDTTKFRNELRQKLAVIERTTSMAVRVDKANLDRTAIREDIRRQMAEMKNVQVDADVRVTIDKAKLKKTALRKSIQAEFDKFDNIRVNIEAAISNKEHFHKEVKDMVDRASRLKVKLNVNAVTAGATTHLKWISRDRIVNLIVKVSKASATKALASLAALSGARLAWKWIDDLVDKMRNLDKNLPAVVGWTTGITSGIAAIFAATSGLVGIGQGLVSITPALLVVPGLLLNALGSATALIVALKNAKKELSPLKDEMHQLGDIINGQFWGEARQPILDLVTGLMPQLKSAFHDLSQGVGEFTGAMADAFGKELSNGRLASIFKGIADGWRVLGTGAEGFAGALVSLSNIAATYTPRLAGWFVRQANTFDKWLKAISEDGRLSDWMETAIGSMHDLWDVTKGVAGVFSGIWKAADAAGSGGLHGFAQLMLEWKRTVNSADFQKGLEAIFRGSSTAMSAFGDAVKAIGRLVADNSKAFETFIGTAGKFLGGLLEGIAKALNTPLVAKGLNGLSDGLIGALNGILPHLPRIADTFGNFLGLLGDLARNLLPTAAHVLEALMPAIDSVIGAIRDSGILPKLADTVKSIVDALAPSVTELVKALAPAVIDVLKLLADALNAVAPLLDPLIRGLAAIVRSIADLLGYLMPASIADLTKNKPDPTDFLLTEKWKTLGVKINIDALADVRLLGRSLEMDPELIDQITGDLFDPKTIGAAETAAKQVGEAFLKKYRETLKTEGKDAADRLVEAIQGSDLPKKVKDAIGQQLNAAGYEYDYFKEAGKTSANLFNKGLNDGKISMDESMKQWRESFTDEFERSGLEGAQAMWDGFNGYDQDSAPMQELLKELRSYGIDIKDVMGDAGKAAGDEAGTGISSELMKKLKSPDFNLGMKKTGEDAAGNLLEGFNGATGGGGPTAGGYSFSLGVAKGIRDGQPDVNSATASLKDVAVNALVDAGSWLVDSGRALVNGFNNGFTIGLPSVTETTKSLKPTAQGAVADSGSWLTGNGQSAAGGFASGILSGLGAISSATGAIRSVVSDAMSGFSLYGVGANLARGLASGMRDSGALGSIASAAASAVETARRSARKAADVNSPSKVMMRDVGMPLAEGIAKGIDKGRAGIKSSVVKSIDFSGLSGRFPAMSGTAGLPSAVTLLDADGSVLARTRVIADDVSRSKFKSPQQVRSALPLI